MNTKSLCALLGLVTLLPAHTAWAQVASAPVQITDAGVGSMQVVAVGNGRVYAAYGSFPQDGPIVSFKRSSDGGQTWSPPIVVSQLPRFRWGSTDPHMVARGNDIYVAWVHWFCTAPFGPDNTSCWQSDLTLTASVTHSGDGGATFAAPQEFPGIGWAYNVLLGLDGAGNVESAGPRRTVLSTFFGKGR